MNFNQITAAHPARARRPFFLSAGFGCLLLLLHPLQAGADGTPTVLSYTNTAPITIVDFLSDASPFPSTNAVPALPGVLQSVTVTLYGLSDPSSGGIEILLAGPSGQAVDLMNLAGSGLVTNATITFADLATPFSGGTITSGTFQPSGTDFPGNSPFYQQVTTNQLAGFIGTPLQGTWNLYEYYNDFTGANGSISGGWSLTFTMLPAAPAVTNLAATDIATTSATLNANVNPEGAATTVYFEYGLTTNYGSFSASNTLAADVADTQAVALPIAGLLPGTTYHYQALAQNSIGTNAGADLTFVTPTAVLSYSNSTPITIIDSFSDASPFPSTIPVPALPGVLQSVTVTLYGLSDLSSGGIEILLAGPSGPAVDLMNLAGSGLVTNATITFADPATPFPGGTITSGAFQPSGTAFPSGSPFYQMAATNQLAGFIGTPLEGTWSLSEYYNATAGANGSISGGWSLTFNLLSAAPAVTNLAATGVTATSATLNANVNPEGAATTVYFEYGPTTAYGSFSASNTLAADVADTQAVALPVTGLLPGTTYHFQALAQNSIGTNAGGDLTFVTPSLPPPMLQASLTNGSNPVLVLYGNPGSNYTIQSTTNLSPPITWTTVTNLILSNAVQFIYPGPLTNRMEFFALLAGAPPAPPRLQAVLTNGAIPVLILYGTPGSNYTILSTASLSPPVTWTGFTNLTLTNAVQFIYPGPATNQMEFFDLLAGNAAPPPRIQVTFNGSTLVVILYGTPGLMYTIQSTSSFSPPITWNSITNLTLTNPVESINLGPPPNQPEFYRAVQP
ncbi:MAG: hypothetical protein ABSG78_15525 [Verrucomicrobiota bacterium]|jgi:hypothetical protein